MRTAIDNLEYNLKIGVEYIRKLLSKQKKRTKQNSIDIAKLQKQDQSLLQHISYLQEENNKLDGRVIFLERTRQPTNNTEIIQQNYKKAESGKSMLESDT